MVNSATRAGKPWPDRTGANAMATTPRTSVGREISYPTSDGKPMAETDVHRENMVDLIETLKDRYRDDPDVYVTGNLLLFYKEGNRRKHISPDVFMVRGVSKTPPREHYLVWEEGKSPDVVIELTSRTTRREDRGKKLKLYRDVLRVREYFLFDPNADLLNPSLQGYRLMDSVYVPIEPVAAHYFTSEVLGLWLVRDGFELRLYDLATHQKILTRRERIAESESKRRQVEAARQEMQLMLDLADARARLSEALQREAETARQLLEARARLAEAENERLRHEIEELRGRLPGS
jgi:Uma2 family endonuclease